MKTLTIQLKDSDGNIQEEKNIEIEESDILIMKYPETMKMADAHRAYMALINGLEDGTNLIGIPQGITFEVLNIK